MNTIVKVILTIVLPLAIGAVVAIIQEAHIFGKVFVSFIWFILLGLIWTNGKEDKSNALNQNPAQQSNSQTIANSVVKPTPTTQGNTNIPTYTGGHNSGANTSQPNPIPQTTVTTKPQSNTQPTNGSKEFNGSDPYTKNKN